MSAEFQDQVVLVTGAGRGLGRAIAEAFAAQGARVAVNDLTPVNLDETIARIRAAGGQAQEYIFDVAMKMPVQAMIGQILDSWGRIDILVNNAGVEPRASLLSMDEWDWRRTVDVNLTGPFFLIQSIGREMSAAGAGVIVNIAASASATAGATDRAAFLASKRGLVGLTEAAAAELGPAGVRVNAVCPGPVDTDARRQRPGERPSSLTAPEAVAGIVLFLCSPAAHSINGQSIEVG